MIIYIIYISLSLFLLEDCKHAVRISVWPAGNLCAFFCLHAPIPPSSQEMVLLIIEKCSNHPQIRRICVKFDDEYAQMYWSLNEVVRDVEDPFVYEPNDLPIARYQVLFLNAENSFLFEECSRSSL